MIKIVQWIALIATICAAVFWIVSASIEVPSDLYTFASALQRASRWSWAAAACAFVAAVCQAYLLYINR